MDKLHDIRIGSGGTRNPHHLTGNLFLFGRGHQKFEKYRVNVRATSDDRSFTKQDLSQVFMISPRVVAGKTNFHSDAEIGLYTVSTGCATAQTNLFLNSRDTVKVNRQVVLPLNFTHHLGDDKGITPLMLAARDGHTNIVKALLENGADVNSKNNKGETALARAIENDRTEIIQMLKNAGAEE